ncbi:serine hydrolase domain-containing protein [Stakelama tenebrarum]|uniref:Beta-lactamase family protein n=1 Tax=Stakelama tenebrarum TaxID=2711215 RepID=A0A6G6Y0L1_9SPHN|nr:serine hydrolase domain-containing protein [Sphingosinithalassobacter tenebrarum]QIG78450.1 beta-lactamase family protein [Sphingosinithalassobacter tenebrarum]
MLHLNRFGLAGIAAAFLATTACIAQTGGQTAPVVSSAPASVATQALVERYVAQDKAPGVVIAYGGRGDPVFASAGNIADGADAAAADPDSLWRVYSMTKPITGMAAMILVEEGKISLDQPVSDFIPGFAEMEVLTDPENSLETRPAAGPVTIRHLLTHTAGLGYNIITKGPLLDEYNRLGINPAAINVQQEVAFRRTRPETLAEFADRVATLPLIADPGTKWSYSIGLDVMGRVIEVASGMSFDQFVQQRLFDPLGMTSSYWTVPQSEVGRLSTNYFFVGDARTPVDPGDNSVFAQPPSFPYGGAGLVMSARDYDRFLHMLLNQGELDGVRVMRAETVRLAMSNLLPEGVYFQGVSGATGGATSGRMGFGAGGSVYLEARPGGAGKGTYGWGGAAGTTGWVDPENGVRGTVMVNYMPSDKWPLRDDAVTAVYADMTP